jgi:hypothetical protein
MGLTDADAKRLGDRLVEELGEEGCGDTDQMLAAAWLMGATAMSNARSGRHVCRICGCWENEACEGGCGWAEADLCTTCGPDVPIVYEIVTPSPEASAQ